MEQPNSYGDDLGPLKIIHVHQPAVHLRATLVVDNVARGPSIGGMRMAQDVSTEECFRLARAMTLKNAAADLPHGGGKMVIYTDPKAPDSEKELQLRCLVQALRNEQDYVFAPDMGTNETCMAWIKDEVDRVVGLPRALGGIPLDEIGATAWGLVQAIRVAADATAITISESRIVIQGFGAVGKHTARFLCEQGATLVAVSDSSGAIYNPAGLVLETLLQLKQQGGSVTDYADAKSITEDELIAITCDIWVPAARPDILTASNADRLDCKIFAQGANIPATMAAEQNLHDRGILVLPDFIANAGGVICAAMEYQGANESAVFPTISDKIKRNTATVIEQSRQQNILPRAAAVALASERVEAAMKIRRWKLF